MNYDDIEKQIIKTAQCARGMEFNRMPESQRAFEDAARTMQSLLDRVRELEAENEVLREVAEAAKCLIEVCAVTDIPQKNQTMATVNAARQRQLILVKTALDKLAKLEQSND